jgi:hypothetical protein
MGLCRDEQPIKYKKILYTDTHLLLDIDTKALPPKLRLEKLSEACEQIAAALDGKRVTYLTNEGFSYIITDKKILPKSIGIEDAGEAPAISYAVPIGHAANGPIWRSLLDLGHILVGGITQSGKSSWLESLIAHAHKQGAQIYVIDPKRVSFLDVEHLMQPAISEIAEANVLIASIVNEMRNREQMFVEAHCKHFRYFKGDIKPIMVVIDEFTDLMLSDDAALDENLKRLATKGAAFGIILVLATQQPKAEVMHTFIRNNCSTRICFRMATASDSRLVLDEAGAEKISADTKGRFLYKQDGKLLELQGYLYSAQLNPELKDLARYVIYELDGQYSLTRLQEAFKGKFTAYRLQTLGSLWESLGYLERDGAGKTAPRIATEVLKKLL